MNFIAGLIGLILALVSIHNSEYNNDRCRPGRAWAWIAVAIVGLFLCIGSIEGAFS